MVWAAEPVPRTMTSTVVVITVVPPVWFRKSRRATAASIWGAMDERAAPSFRDFSYRREAQPPSSVDQQSLLACAATKPVHVFGKCDGNHFVCFGHPRGTLDHT